MNRDIVVVMRRVFVVVTMIAGGACDQAFGLTGNDLPECDLSSFANVTPEIMPAADMFSFDQTLSRAIVERNGQQFESDAGGDLVVDFGLSTAMLNVALSPEGDRVFFTYGVEGLTVSASRRVSRGKWTPEATPPRGALAGTPTAKMFGPRQIVVRIDAFVPLNATLFRFQEYRQEDDEAPWIAIGERHEIEDVTLPPNLSPDGLTMVYTASTPSAEPGQDDYAVYAAQRSSLDEWFREPVMLLPPAPRAGREHSPQLSADCRRLDVIGTRPMLEDNNGTDHFILRYKR